MLTPGFHGAIAKGWSINGIVRARSGFPVNVVDAETALGLSFANIFRPNLVAGVPLWITDSSLPGGKQLESLGISVRLFRRKETSGVMPSLALGCRSWISRCAATSRSPSDLHSRYEPKLSTSSTRPVFADPLRFLSSPLFGQSTSMLNLMLGSGTPSTGLTPAFQIGGPRSLQLVLRFRF